MAKNVEHDIRCDYAPDGSVRFFKKNKPERHEKQMTDLIRPAICSMKKSC
jgi:hypothetical protein